MSICLNDGEMGYLQELAAVQGLQLAAYLRLCAFVRKLPPIVPPINKKEWRKLSTLGNNLNQIVIAIHKGSIKDTMPIVPLIGKLIDEIKSLQAALRGHEPSQNDLDEAQF